MRSATREPGISVMDRVLIVAALCAVSGTSFLTSDLPAQESVKAPAATPSKQTGEESPATEEEKLEAALPVSYTHLTCRRR